MNALYHRNTAFEKFYGRDPDGADYESMKDIKALS